MSELNGKTLILTGGSYGIGRAVALQLARIGANVVVNARNVPHLVDTFEQCQKLGVKADYVAGNIAVGDTARELVDKAINLGNFFGFIHSAGLAEPGPFLWELSEEKFSAILGANLIGAYQLIHFAIPELLKQQRGIAVFVGSGAADITFPGLGAYCVAKAAEEHLAKQLAAEAPSITAFIYRPGVVDTRLQEQARTATGGAAAIVRQEFRSYKERGHLIPPDLAAERLVDILVNNPRRFHGKVAT